MAVALLNTSAARAADCPPAAGDCKSIASAGSLGAAIDLIIVGDGYTAADRDKFFKDAEAAANGLTGSEMYIHYKPVFNTWALFTPSAQSGADDPSAGVFVDTAYDATYDGNNIDYLLTANTAKIYNDVNKRFPESDLILCLVNSTQYGGSGGGVAVISTDASSLEIARHEIGHILANLADEYTAAYPGYPDGDPEPNVALTSHLEPLKWQHWVPDGTAIPTPDASQTSVHDPVGAYEGARYKTTGVFRPTPDCIMRELNITFCQVCAEAMVRSISNLSLLIDAPTPASPAAIPAVGPTTFSATIPALEDLMFSWDLDGKPLPSTESSLSLDPAALGLADGAHTLTLGVYDATPLVRNDPNGVMKEAFTWNITVDSTLPPATTASSSGAGGSASGGAGGSGGSPPEDGGCGCRLGGQDPAPSSWWLLSFFAAVGLAGRRLRSRRTIHEKNGVTLSGFAKGARTTE